MSTESPQVRSRRSGRLSSLNRKTGAIGNQTHARLEVEHAIRRQPLPMIVAGVAFLLALGALILTLSNRTQRIGYVRSHELVLKYEGMMEAKRAYQARKAIWMAELDSLGRAFDSAAIRFQRESSQMPASARTAVERDLLQQRQSVVARRDVLEQKAKDEDRDMTQGVLNKVNTLLKAYAQDQGYDIVLGTTDDGSLLHGDPAMDITDQVLSNLNQEYRNAPVTR